VRKGRSEGVSYLFISRASRMLAYIALGIVIYGVILVLYVFYNDYLQVNSEGFRNVPQDVFAEKIIPGGNEEESVLSPGSTVNELLAESVKLPAMDQQQARANWGRMTSETCYRSDKSEVLNKTRNFFQRTNNYIHTHPDSCSAPNHELIGTFYKPFDGVGQTPDKGYDIPPNATCLK